MNKQHSYYVPSPRATKLEYFIGKRDPIIIIRDDNQFYLIEKEMKRPLGGLISLFKFLKNINAKYLDNRNKPRKLFLNREEARSMLDLGFTILDVESAVFYSYTGDYTKIVSSNNLVLDNDLPPAKTWCIDFTEARLTQTKKEVLEERQNMKTELSNNKIKQQQREAVKTIFDLQRNSNKIVRGIEPKVQANNDTTHQGNQNRMKLRTSLIALSAFALGCLTSHIINTNK